MCWRPAALRLRWTALSNAGRVGSGGAPSPARVVAADRPPGQGLEFDHVVVLDGGWDRASEGEDADAPRRLYYEAMTRAKQTLTLLRLPGRHRFQDALLNTSSALLQREPVALTPPAPELSRRYQRLSLRDVFPELRRLPGAGASGACRHLRAFARRPASGASGADRWELLDQRGTVVGQLARGFRAPSGVRCASQR